MKPIICCLAALLVVACNGKTAAPTAAPEPAKTGTVLATVNGAPITSDEFDATANRQVAPSSSTIDDAEKREILDLLVADELLFRRALAEGLQHDPAVKRALVTSLLKRDVYNNSVNDPISDEDARAYFDSHREEFVVPEKIQVRRILLRAKGGEDAAQLKQRAADMVQQIRARPESFRDLARAHSQDVYAQRGGDIGFISTRGKPGLPEVVVQKAFAQEVGEVSEPFEADDGWNIVSVTNRRERIERSYDQMRAAVERKLRTERQRARYDGYVEQLKTGAVIEIDDQALAQHAWERDDNPLTRPMTRTPGGAGLKPAPLPGDRGGD
jgi:peptidyl-prolyl cis-trans isomerase C